MLAIGALAFLWRNHAVFIWAGILGIALGIGIGSCFAAALHDAQANAEGLSGRWRCEALTDATSGLHGSSCFARVGLPNKKSCIARIYFTEQECPVRYGELFEMDAELTLPEQAASSRCWQHGAVVEARANNMIKHKRTDIIGAIGILRGEVIECLANLDESGADVLAALTCGWRGQLDKDVYHAFQVAGVAHIIAVSGAHLCLLTTLINLLLRRLNTPRTLSYAIQSVFLLGYALLAALPASVVRATVMVFATMLAPCAHRRSSALSALSLCIIGYLILDPSVALSLSFALSALSTLSIVLFSPLILSWLSAWSGIPRFVREALSLTFASGILTLPLSAALFSQISLIAPLVNIVVTPMLAPICALGFMGVMGVLIAPNMAYPILIAACKGSCLLTHIIEIFAGFAHASIPFALPVFIAPVLSVSMAAILWIWWPHLHRRSVAFTGVVAVCITIVAVIYFPCQTADEIIMLDIGQGDAFVIRSRGTTLLIDTGNQDRLLHEALARHNILALDGVIITHSDDDHRGSLSSLAGIVEVDSILVAQDAFSCNCASCKSLIQDATKLVGKTGVQGLSVGDRILVGAFTLRVVWPNSYSDKGGNADSVCFVAEADIDSDNNTDWSALFVGDAEYEQVQTFVERGEVGKVDIYKVGHHGSRNALNDTLVNTLSPRIALVSVGANNRYGHPADETLKRLNAVGANILRTDEEGDVSCKLKADRILINKRNVSDSLRL